MNASNPLRTTWGLRTRHDAEAAERARKEPLTVAELSAYAEKALTKRATDEWRNPSDWPKSIMDVTDGSWSSADVERLKGYLDSLSPMAQARSSEYAFGNLFLAAHEDASFLDPRRPVASEKMVEAALNLVQLGIAHVNGRGPKTLTEKEVAKLTEGDAVLGYVVEQFFTGAIEAKVREASEVLEPDPAALALRTDDDFLAYNAQRYLEDSELSGLPFPIGGVIRGLGLGDSRLRPLVETLDGLLDSVDLADMHADVVEVSRKPGDETVVGYILTAEGESSEMGRERHAWVLTPDGRTLSNTVESWLR